MSKIKVLILQEIIPNYRVAFFKKLSLFEDIDLTVIHTRVSEKLKREGFKDSNVGSEFKNILLDNTGTSVFKYWSELFKIIKKENPNIIVTGLWARNAYLILIYKIIFRFKLIFWFGGTPYKDEIKNTEYVNELKNKKNFVSPFQIFLNNCNRFIMYSDNGKEFMIKNFNTSPEKVFVAPNSPDTNLFFEKKNEFDKDKTEVEKLRKKFAPNHEKIILTLGRINKDRRLDLLLKTFSEIQKSYSNVSFVIIGDGSEKSEMENFSKELSIKNIFFEGEIYDDNEIAKYFYIADVFVYSGVASLAIKIAMSFGVPVAGFDYGLEVFDIEDVKTGYVVPFGDTKLLSEKVLILLNNDELRKKIGKNAFNVIKDKINLENMTNSFVSALIFKNRN